MLHWFPDPAVAFAGARTTAFSPTLPGDPVRPEPTARARHALMLGYAAQRRRAAGGGADAVYWKISQAHALGRARELRFRGGFRRLP